MDVNELIQEIKSGKLDRKQVFKAIRDGLKTKKGRPINREPATSFHVRVRVREKTALEEEAKQKGVSFSELIRKKVLS
jgi:predicted HicB family RNase H-like nuclease